MTSTAHRSALRPKPSKPEATSTAVTLAAVAMATQPRYRPTVPSATIVSIRFLGRVRSVSWNARISTTSRSTITGTLSQSRSNWMLRIQAAFSTSDAAIG